MPKKNLGKYPASRMREQMMQILMTNGGWCTADQLADHISKTCGKRFTTVDRQRLKNGKRRWENTLDWAKATATSDRKIVSCRIGGQTLIISTEGYDADSFSSFVITETARKPKSQFKMKCPACEWSTPLPSKSKPDCVQCGTRLPDPTPSRKI